MGACGTRPVEVQKDKLISPLQCLQLLKECFNMLEFYQKEEPLFFTEMCEKLFGPNIQPDEVEAIDIKKFKMKFRLESIYKVIGVLNQTFTEYAEASGKFYSNIAINSGNPSASLGNGALKKQQTQSGAENQKEGSELQKYKEYLFYFKQNIELITEEYGSLESIDEKFKFKAVLLNYGVLMENKKQFFDTLDQVYDGTDPRENPDPVGLLFEQLNVIIASDIFAFNQIKSLLFSTSVFIKEKKFAKVNLKEIYPLVEKILDQGGAMVVFRELLKKKSLVNDMKAKEIVYQLLEDLDEHTYLIYMGHFTEYAVTTRHTHAVFINNSYMHPDIMEFNKMYIAFCIIYELGHQLRMKYFKNEKIHDKEVNEVGAGYWVEKQVFGGILDFLKLQRNHWKAREFVEQLDKGISIKMKDFFKGFILNEKDFKVLHTNHLDGIYLSPSFRKEFGKEYEEIDDTFYRNESGKLTSRRINFEEK